MGLFNIFKGKKEEVVQPEKPPVAAPVDEQSEEELLDKSLEKTRTGFFSRLGRALVGKSTVDAAFLDELEEILVSSDVGIETTVKIIERLEKRVARDKYINAAELDNILREEIQAILVDRDADSVSVKNGLPSGDPYVIMIVGVNGVGKTTTIGKLAYLLRQQGKTVMVGAADTFRAAAIEQLKIWAQRADVPIVHRDMGSDPAAVAFDTVQSAKAKGIDVVILDTAGRLHNKLNLMNELSKVERVVKKVIPDAPHETVLILDASTGQNAFEQAKQFIEFTKVNTLAITKLDGTAKGGVVLGIVDQFQIPVRYIGVGERIQDLQLFDKVKFVDSLFHNS